MLERIIAVIGLVATGLLLIVINLTTPSTVGAGGILAIFLLSYIIIFCFLTFILWLMSKLIGKARHVFHWGHPREPMSFRKAYYYSTVIALAPVILLSLQSVGGVGVYELGLIVLLIVLGCIYVTRRTA